LEIVLFSTDHSDPETSIDAHNIKFNFVYELSNIYNNINDSLIYARGTGGVTNDHNYLVLDLDSFFDVNTRP
jgi:hypothetical protein